MIYLLDTDTLIFIIRGLESGPRQQALREPATKIVERCRQAQQSASTPSR
jgi:hypothetical protein